MCFADPAGTQVRSTTTSRCPYGIARLLLRRAERKKGAAGLPPLSGASLAEIFPEMMLGNMLLPARYRYVAAIQKAAAAKSHMVRHPSVLRALAELRAVPDLQAALEQRAADGCTLLGCTQHAQTPPPRLRDRDLKTTVLVPAPGRGADGHFKTRPLMQQDFTVSDSRLYRSIQRVLTEQRPGEELTDFTGRSGPGKRRDTAIKARAKAQASRKILKTLKDQTDYEVLLDGADQGSGAALKALRRSSLESVGEQRRRAATAPPSRFDANYVEKRWPGARGRFELVVRRYYGRMWRGQLCDFENLVYPAEVEGGEHPLGGVRIKGHARHFGLEGTMTRGQRGRARTARTIWQGGDTFLDQHQTMLHLSTLTRRGMTRKNLATGTSATLVATRATLVTTMQATRRRGLQGQQAPPSPT